MLMKKKIVLPHLKRHRPPLLLSTLTDVCVSVAVYDITVYINRNQVRPMSLDLNINLMTVKTIVCIPNGTLFST